MSTNEWKQVGYQALVRQFDLKVIPHFQTSTIAERGGRKTFQQANGLIEEQYPKSYDPGTDLVSQVSFALRYEGVNLEILGAVFEKIDPASIVEYVLKKRTGTRARQLWYLYELLTGNRLNGIPDLDMGNYVDLLDPIRYYTGVRVQSRRHRINDNLLGDRTFCPFVRRTPLLAQFEDKKLDQRTVNIIREYPEDVISRAVHYLYTKETKSSYEIERDQPDEARVSRFVATLKAAGRKDFLTREQLVWLQNQIVDARFINPDYRTTQNYIGESISLDRELVHYVPPKPQDVRPLMDGLLQSHARMFRSGVYPVVHATAIAFGFVFIHPFDDGNGRIHRFLIHHILAASRFTPEGVIFPVSATLLRNIRRYDEILEAFSTALMPLIDYTLDADGTMEVRNETARHYRSIDMTKICETMFQVLEETIETELPTELNLLVSYDRIKNGIQGIIDMPDQKIDQFIKFCLHNGGRLSAAKRAKFFHMLKDEEITQLERVIQETTHSAGSAQRKPIVEP
ncbi:Fic family protein [Bdellovibrionota bacterium FG-1]